MAVVSSRVSNKMAIGATSQQYIALRNMGLKVREIAAPFMEKKVAEKRFYLPELLRNIICKCNANNHGMSHLNENERCGDIAFSLSFMIVFED